MRILVCLKQVPDTTEVKLSADFTLQRDFIAQIMNPADESALELALQLRTAHQGHVTVLSMGPRRAENMLREALARGVDQAVLLSDPGFAGADTLVTAQCLQAAIRYLGGFDLILCGKRAVDGETGQVGPMLGSLMDIPSLVNLIKAEIREHTVSAWQLTEDGQTQWEAPLPALLTLCEWSYPLRLPSILGLRRAKNAPVQVLTPSDLGIASCGLKASPTRVIHVDASPAGVRPCQMISPEDGLKKLLEGGLIR